MTMAGRFRFLQSGLIASGLGCLLLAACADEEQQEEPAVAVTAAPDTMPPPISVPVDTVQVEQAEDPIDRVRQRLNEIGAQNLLVIRAAVGPSTVTERVLPGELHWGEVSHVVTTLTLEVLETYCGASTQEVRVSYVGGTLPDGTVERTEFMPTDLSVGGEYIFILRRLDGEYFLELGRNDLLRRGDLRGFQDASGELFPVDQLRGLCP